MTHSQSHLDGNAAAGALAEVFGRDVTEAFGACRQCGRRSRLAETHTHLGGPGVVLRCPGCDAVVLRAVSSPTETWLDTGGLSYLQLPRPPA